MNIFKALATVVGTALGFAIAGMGIGVFLSTYAPSFYRLVLPIREGQEYNMTELGIGLGTMNGLIWGLVVGTLLVMILSWKETRTLRNDEP